MWPCIFFFFCREKLIPDFFLGGLAEKVYLDPDKSKGILSVVHEWAIYFASASQRHHRALASKVWGIDSKQHFGG